MILTTNGSHLNVNQRSIKTGGPLIILSGILHAREPLYSNVCVPFFGHWVCIDLSRILTTVVMIQGSNQLLLKLNAHS